MNKIISEGIEAAAQVSESKNKKRGGGFPHKTVLLTLGIGALVIYKLANANPSTKKC